eukprot:gene25931-32479_t
MDSSMFAVYEYADDLPLYLISLEDIISVNPCSREPIDHVFDVVLRTRKLRFTCGSASARSTWIALVDLNKHELRQRSPSSAIATVDQISCRSLIYDSNSSESANKSQVTDVDSTIGVSGHNANTTPDSFHTHDASLIDERFLRHYEDFRHALFRTNYYHSLNELSQSS